MLEVAPGQQLGLKSLTVAARVFKRQAMTENVGQTQHPVDPCVWKWEKIDHEHTHRITDTHNRIEYQVHCNSHIQYQSVSQLCDFKKRKIQVQFILPLWLGNLLIPVQSGSETWPSALFSKCSYFSLWASFNKMTSLSLCEASPGFQSSCLTWQPGR